MWGRFDDQITHHPKLLKAGVRAAYFFFAGIIYCARYRTDGYIPKEALPILAPMRDYNRLARTLVEARVPTSTHGLWEEVEGGYRVHDFLVYQPSAAAMAQREDADRARLRAAREAARGGQGEAPSSATVEADGAEHEVERSPAPTAVEAAATVSSAVSFKNPVHGERARRTDVAATSRRRRPVPSPSPIPVPDRSQDHGPVCAPEPRAPERDAGGTHTEGRDGGRGQREIGASEEAPEVVDAASEVLHHLQAMPPPLCHLATPELAARFASARLTGLGLDDIRRAITAAALKIGKHATARADEPATLVALADHVGRFLANQTPAVAPLAVVTRAESEPAAIERFLHGWGVLYAKVEGIDYVATDEDRGHAAEIVAAARQVARDQAPRLSAEPDVLEEKLTEHWIRAYLRDEGVNMYLAKARHPLRYLKRGVATYGLPRVPRLVGDEGAAELALTTLAPSGIEVAERSREILRVLDGGPGLAKAPPRPGDVAAAAGAG